MAAEQILVPSGRRQTRHTLLMSTRGEEKEEEGEEVKEVKEQEEEEVMEGIVSKAFVGDERYCFLVKKGRSL